MRIGIDIGPITSTRTGVGNYCFYLLKHLLPLAPDDTFHGFASGRAQVDLGELAGRVGHKHVPIPTRILYAVWNALGTPKVDNMLGGVDVYHATNFYLPPTRTAKTVLTIHDLAFWAKPEWCSPKIVGPFFKAVGHAAKNADHIMAYSEATKRDIVRFLDANPEKITVAPMAVDEAFAPLPRDEATKRATKDYGVETPFLLFVSTLEPRKNIPTLLEAFAKIADDIPHNLVLIGSVGWNAEPIFEAIDKLGLQDRVIRPGFVPHMELPVFYCAADAFVFPTHYEGFGLPLLEALTCGCPVVTSDNSSVPEVTGDAALASDANDVDAIAANILRVLNESDLREDMISKGQRHAQRYSWGNMAQATLDVYRSVAL
jgi:glycosyltransferase involved in cell wall biosynthesis